MKFLPKAKLENIVVNNLNNEVLIYDLTTNQAFCLNSTAANVFNACDGVTTFDELKAKYNYTDEIMYLSLDKLKERYLLEGEYVSPFAGLSRREVIRKVGLASMIALPVISAMVAPMASMAASTCVNPNGAAAGQPAGPFGCSTSTTAQCSASCNASATVKARCCSGNVTATAGGSCGLANCCVCA